METKKLSTEQIALLKSPLPAQAITQHPTKSYLSSIKAIYVIERLNDVFGIGSYRFKNREITKEGKMVVVESILIVPEYGIEIPCYGGNDNIDLGDAYKGAATDALTKIGSYLGIGMDVFKGLGDKAKKDPTPVTVWLSDLEFEMTMQADKQGMLAVLKAYNGQAGKSMTSEQLNKLTAQLPKAKERSPIGKAI